MRTVSCKKCSRKVSDQYSFCPNCLTLLNLKVNENLDVESLLSRFSGSRVVLVLSSLSATAALLIEYLWLIPKGMVTQENRDLAYWILLLPIQFVFFAAYTLITGEEPKMGKTRYSATRSVRAIAIVAAFAFLGFLLGGQNGVILGIILGIVIAIVVLMVLERIFKHTRKR